MGFFTKDYNQFFIELAANNHKEWFDENRKRYEKSVKEPFKSFVTELISRVNQDDASINPEAKNCIFRINRDIRFSKDKTPYKLHNGAVITAGGRKDHSKPGLYVQMGPEDIRVYGGLYMTDKDTLYRIREYMMNNASAFNKVLKNKGFVEKYRGELLGDKNKVIPKEFKAAAEKQPLIYNKGWYYYAKLSPDLSTDDNLVDIIMEHYAAGKPMKEFLTKAITY